MRKQFSAVMYFLVVLALASASFAMLFGANPGHAEGVIGRDKYQHAAVSAGLGAVARLQTTDPVKAWFMAMGPGLAKEISDARKGGSGFSWRDLVADGIGAYVGVKVAGVILSPRSITYTRSF